MSWSVEERRRWAFPPREGVVQGVELSLLDPADSEDRRLLIRLEHPELEEALRSDLEEVEVDGEPMSPHAHLAIHEAVANQLWEGEPPEAWQTARRLDLIGYDRHEIFHMLGSVVSEEIWHVLHEGRTPDPARMKERLEALPGSWELERMRRRKGDPEA